jgi:Xaa-Pro dipeptidase
MLGLRGSVKPDAGLMRKAAEEIKQLLVEAGVADMPLGVDIVEPPMMHELQRQNLEVRDGQQVMLDAREVKNIDEIVLLNQAAAMVDGVYQMINDKMKPGVRESDMVAEASKMLYELGSEQIEAINAISGERCNPHPHNFTDRLFRPGDQAFFDIIHAYQGYRTCYYRTLNIGRATDSQNDAYKKAREWLDLAIERVRPGVTTDKVAEVWPRAEELGFANEMECFGLQFGHGLGVGLHERPIISRLISMDDPVEIQEGMVFALETYCPATDGFSGARIEEEVVVTNDGCRVITLFPADYLPIANPY